MARARSIPGGFTLLEMLVALSLIGALASGVYASLHIAFRARAGAEEALAPVRAAMLALELVGRDLTCAVPPSGVLAGFFTGEDGGSASVEDADTLDLHALVTDPVSGIPAIRRLEYALVPAEDDTDFLLVRRVTANLLAPVTPEPEEEVLCRGVVSLDITYFDGAAWVESWDSTAHDDSAPSAVAVSLGVRVPERRAGAEEEYVLTRHFLLPATTPVVDREAISGRPGER